MSANDSSRLTPMWTLGRSRFYADPYGLPRVNLCINTEFEDEQGHPGELSSIRAKDLIATVLSQVSTLEAELFEDSGDERSPFQPEVNELVSKAVKDYYTGLTREAATSKLAGMIIHFDTGLHKFDDLVGANYDGEASDSYPKEVNNTHSSCKLELADREISLKRDPVTGIAHLQWLPAVILCSGSRRYPSEKLVEACKKKLSNALNADNGSDGEISNKLSKLIQKADAYAFDPMPTALHKTLGEIGNSVLVKQGVRCSDFINNGGKLRFERLDSKWLRSVPMTKEQTFNASRLLCRDLSAGSAVTESDSEQSSLPPRFHRIFQEVTEASLKALGEKPPAGSSPTQWSDALCRLTKRTHNDLRFFGAIGHKFTDGRSVKGALDDPGAHCITHLAVVPDSLVPEGQTVQLPPDTDGLSPNFYIKCHSDVCGADDIGEGHRLTYLNASSYIPISRCRSQVTETLPSMATDAEPIEEDCNVDATSAYSSHCPGLRSTFKKVKQLLRRSDGTKRPRFEPTTFEGPFDGSEAETEDEYEVVAPGGWPSDSIVIRTKPGEVPDGETICHPPETLAEWESRLPANSPLRRPVPGQETE